MKENEEILSLIKSEIKKYFPDALIILFGSRARKENDVDSDYDLLIITQKNMSISLKRDFKTKIRKDLIKHNILSDIMIESNDEIKIKKLLPGHIIKNAIAEGIII